MRTDPSPKMSEKRGEYLLPGEYVMIDDALCLVVSTNWPYLVISRFAGGRHGPPEAYRIVKDQYYLLPSPEFIYAMGALTREDVLEKSGSFLVVVDDSQIAPIPQDTADRPEEIAGIPEDTSTIPGDVAGIPEGLGAPLWSDAAERRGAQRSTTMQPTP